MISQRLIGPPLCAFGSHFNLFFCTQHRSRRCAAPFGLRCIFLFPRYCILAANASLGSDTPTAFVEKVGRNDSVQYRCGHQRLRLLLSRCTATFGYLGAQIIPDSNHIQVLLCGSHIHFLSGKSVVSSYFCWQSHPDLVREDERTKFYYPPATTGLCLVP